MKHCVLICLIISLFRLTNFTLLAKPDSTEINIQVGFKDSETNQLAELIKVEKITVSFSDSNLIGKKFLISKAEYFNGEKKEEKDLIKCGKDSVNTIIDGEKIKFMLPDACEKMSYKRNDTTFSIQFLCDNSSDTSKFIIEFPRITLKFNVGKKEQSSYHLCYILSSNYSKYIPVNQKIPIVAFSPPFEMGNGVSDYCILTNKPVEEWHKYYKLNHYIVFYLEIKD